MLWCRFSYFNLQVLNWNRKTDRNLKTSSKCYTEEHWTLVEHTFDHISLPLVLTEPAVVSVVTLPLGSHEPF